MTNKEKRYIGNCRGDPTQKFPSIQSWISGCAIICAWYSNVPFGCERCTSRSTCKTVKAWVISHKLWEIWLNLRIHLRRGDKDNEHTWRHTNVSMPSSNSNMFNNLSLSMSSKQHGYPPATTCCGTIQLLHGVGPDISLGWAGLIYSWLRFSAGPWRGESLSAGPAPSMGKADHERRQNKLLLKKSTGNEHIECRTNSMVQDLRTKERGVQVLAGETSSKHLWPSWRGLFGLHDVLSSTSSRTRRRIDASHLTVCWGFQKVQRKEVSDEPQTKEFCPQECHGVVLSPCYATWVHQETTVSSLCSGISGFPIHLRCWCPPTICHLMWVVGSMVKTRNKRTEISNSAQLKSVSGVWFISWSCSGRLR